jgi:hypothetical protein
MKFLYKFEKDIADNERLEEEERRVPLKFNPILASSLIPDLLQG